MIVDCSAEGYGLAYISKSPISIWSNQLKFTRSTNGMSHSLDKVVERIGFIFDSNIDSAKVLFEKEYIFISFYDLNSNLLFNDKIHIEDDYGGILIDYKASDKTAPNLKWMRSLWRLVSLQNVPLGFWDESINRLYNHGHWDAASELVVAKSRFQAVPFDQTKRFFSPDFIIIGTMKGGTSSLYDYLCLHPSIIDRRPKELHFFTQNYEKGIEAYRKFFSEKQRYRMIGEASPSYFDWFTDKIKSRIDEHCPNSVIFLILGDPVKRAISHYYHELRLKSGSQLGEDFVNAKNMITVDRIKKDIENGNDLYIKISHYENRIDNWRPYFESGRMLIFSQKELSNSPNSVVNRACHALGIRKISIDISGVKRSNVNRYPEPDPSVFEFLERMYIQTKKYIKENYELEL